MSIFRFNYKYLRDNAKPGSWRRGFEVHQKNLVENVTLTKNVLSAQVKGNYKAFYDVSLTFKKGSIEPKCSCPLNEKWCKHAIALAVKAIENKTYDKFIEQKYGVPVDYSDEIAEPLEKTFGAFVFHLNSRRRQNFFSVLVIERSTGKVIRDIEGFFKKKVLQFKDEYESAGLTHIQKANLEIFKMLFATARLDKKSGWWDIPILKAEPLFDLLAATEELLDGRTKTRLTFRDKPWTLVVAVNFSMVGNVLVSLFWKRPDKDEIIPFENVRYFSRNIKWARYKNILFPINISVGALPQNLTKTAFTDIKDADGARFLYEELPKIREITEVETAEVIDKLTLEESKPVNIVTLGLDYDGSLRASLDFEYDGTRVPYSKQTDKSPYVTVKKPKEDLLYWVKRNRKHEELAFQMLLACKFAPMQTNNLGLEKENAVDFYNYYMKQAGEGWVFEEKDNMEFFKISEEPLKICADLDFCEKSTDSFTVKLYSKIGDEIIDYNELYNCFNEDCKYLKFNTGFVEVPLSDMDTLRRAMNSVDVYKNDDNIYQIKTYRAGILTEMQHLNVEINMTRKFSKFWKQISTFSNMDNVTLPKGVDAEFREYQTKGFGWLWFLYQYGLNGVLADDMGLGKTLQALTLLQKAKEKNKSAPNLVICPTSVVFNWEAEIQKFIPSLKCLKLSGTERKEYFKDIDKYDIVITSYALVRRDIDVLKEFNFRYVILDESQNIKNADSQTAQCVKQLNCQHKLALSGTPIENRLEELWSLFDFLMPGFLFTKAEFNHKFVIPITEREDRNLEKRLKSQIFPFILRRMKRDVAKDLPDKVENISYCELTPEQKDFYLEVLDSTKEELFKSIEQNGLEKSRLSIFSALLRLRQICCHPKLYDKDNLKGIIHSGKFEQLKIMLEQIIEEKHRVLLFSQFVDMLDIIKAWLIKEGIKYEYLTGNTKNRGEVVEKFNTDPTIPIFLISLKAGGTGLNLTGADYVIHYDPWWNPAVEDQATDRAYRIGQTKKVFVYRLITKGTVEEKIQRLKQRKRNLVDSVISVDRNIGKSLTYEDLQDIFSLD